MNENAILSQLQAIYPDKTVTYENNKFVISDGKTEEAVCVYEAIAIILKNAYDVDMRFWD